MSSGRRSRRSSGSGHRVTVVQREFMEDLEHRVRTDRKVALKALRLMKEVRRDPFTGVEKPEPLKHLGPDIWSRRITAQDRLVYRVVDDEGRSGHRR